MRDLVIIGSGPAGLSAAVYAKRAALDVVVVEKEAFSGGQIINTERVDNYLGLYGISGFDMGMKFREHADKLEVPFVEGEVRGIPEKDGCRLVELDNGETIQTKAVLIATGTRHRTLGAPGEKEFTGAGVSYCATCDGAFFRNKDVVVVGGGDVALEDALYLSNGCANVYLVHRRDGFRAAKVLQDQVKQTANIEFLPFYEVESIDGQGCVSGVTLVQNQTKEHRKLEVAGVFVAVGTEPVTGFAQKEVDMDDAGFIVADETGQTSAKDIFVAGDVRTKQLRQVITAVSDGANALTSIEHFLK